MLIVNAAHPVKQSAHNTMLSDKPWQILTEEHAASLHEHSHWSEVILGLKIDFTLEKVQITVEARKTHNTVNLKIKLKMTYRKEANTGTAEISRYYNVV
jgi:hypothetical protein